MSTRHTGSRFARHLENIPRVATKGVVDFNNNHNNNYYNYINNNNNKGLMTTFLQGSSTFVMN